MNRFLLLIIAGLLAVPTGVSAQVSTDETPPDRTQLVAPTPAAQRSAGDAAKMLLADTSLVGNVDLVNIGPTVMSGRVVDIDANPADPTEFYVAYASGGLWKTTNNGLSFTPVFDGQGTLVQGDVAVDWTHGETIWVGTGENNSSRSSYAGNGVYKSTDGGETWQHLGLEETHRTGRIVLHPDDPNTVWVAALGHLYSPNEERGVYKTTDGGRSWQKTLFVDDDTGAIDLVIDPDNPDVLYAAMWHRERRAWNFVESGAGSGIYKSTDGGESWQLLTTPESGFPSGHGVGRIGLTIYPGDADVLYAVLDNQNRQPEEEEEEKPALTRDDIRDMSKDEFLEVSEDALEDYLRENGFPAAYTAKSILEMVRTGKIEPIALVEYLEDANRMLFDTPVIGLEVYRSTDGGATWARTHEDPIDGVYFSYGYYFGEVRVAPDAPDRIYVMGVPILRSTDGGATFASINEPNVHVDHHALWVSPVRPGHLINGNDGGVNVSYDDGETWFKANTPSVGQFYAVQVDEAEPYNVYGGLQDNGVWTGPHTYEQDYGWYAEGDYPYDRLLGGDGMQVEVDTRTNDVVYTGFQFGNYFRVDKQTGNATSIQPKHELGERPLRFNWQTPIHLSRHNQDILYLGSNKFHRSFNRGDDWETLSGDLTKGGKKGDVPYGTLTTIDESPLQFGLIYVGSDDGLVHVTRDGGNTWTRISDDLPQDFWVSRVEASHHATDRVYVSLNGYRSDNFEALVFRSDDAGSTWTRIGRDLPMEPVNVVLEDPSNEDVLYVGTDGGLYVSLNRGASFMAFGPAIPNVAVHDLKVQQREKDLIVGTHGRSIYRVDLEEIQQLTPALVAEPVHLFAIDPVMFDEDWGGSFASWAEPRVPEVQVPFYAQHDGAAVIRIETSGGRALQEVSDDVERGLNYVTYDLSVAPEHVEAFNRERRGEDEDAEPVEAADDGTYYLVPGTYSVTVVVNGDTSSGTLEVKDGAADRDEEEPFAEPSEEEEIK